MSRHHRSGLVVVLEDFAAASTEVADGAATSVGVSHHVLAIDLASHSLWVQVQSSLAHQDLWPVATTTTAQTWQPSLSICGVAVCVCVCT